MGARWYGFSPVKIEKGSGIRFADMFHGHDERVPVAGLAWGAEVLDAVVREICGERTARDTRSAASRSAAAAHRPSATESVAVCAPTVIDALHDDRCTE